MSDHSDPADYAPRQTCLDAYAAKCRTDHASLASYCRRLNEDHPIVSADWLELAEAFGEFMNDDPEGVLVRLVWDRDAVWAVAQSAQTREIRERADLYFKALSEAKVRRVGLMSGIERAREVSR